MSYMGINEIITISRKPRAIGRKKPGNYRISQLKYYKRINFAIHCKYLFILMCHFGKLARNVM